MKYGLICVNCLSFKQVLPGGGCANMSSNPWTSRGRLYGQNYKKLLALHLKSNSLFEDPYFPPTSSSLSSSGKVEGDWARGEASATYASDIKWVRASNLFPNAQLVIEGVSKDDVNQGR